MVEPPVVLERVRATPVVQSARQRRSSKRGKLRSAQARMRLEQLNDGEDACDRMVHAAPARDSKFQIEPQMRASYSLIVG